LKLPLARLRHAFHHLTPSQSTHYTQKRAALVTVRTMSSTT
jgi:hypothetical protein